MLKELTSSEQEDYLSQIELFKHYKKSPFLSIKHASYFQVYEELLSKYKNKKLLLSKLGYLMAAHYLCGEVTLENKQE